ncbi:MAG: DUF4435 domain-containing protein [Caldilineaceae bacterium]|nr:DUF4435 domain-containing protein [Caldilineaceae bacterium]
MRRSQFPGTFLIVEGRDDRLLMEGFVSPSACKVEVAEGKQAVCEVLEVLDSASFGGVLGVIDSDFDRIEGIPERSQNLVMPECHDLIMMIVRSPALDRTLTELGSRRKIEAFEGDVLEALIDRALPLGYMRLYSLRERLDLRFKDLSYSAWISLSSFAADTSVLIETVKNHSQCHLLSSSALSNAMEELQRFKYDPYEICNGTDVIEILSIGLRRVLGNNNAREVSSESLKSSLRLAYSDQHFRSSSLGRDIEEWQSQNPGFQVLKSDMT